MKVLCIDASPGKVTGTIPNFNEGQTVTASQCPKSKGSFIIKEHLVNKFGGSISWAKKDLFHVPSLTKQNSLKRD